VTKLRIAKAAQQDLRDIRIYSKAAFGPVIAKAYLNGLRQAFGLLRERPFAGSAEDDLGGAMRGLTHRSHRIYYRTLDDEVLIVRILHHRRDAASAFRQDQ
jgi:toxin ParE1/3/4